MISQRDKAKRWQFSLRTMAAAVAAVAICVWVVVAIQTGIPGPSVHDLAVEAYRHGSYTVTVARCDQYLSHYPNGDEADKVRELRKLAQAVFAPSAPFE